MQSFEGISGAISVSIVAFSIVFGVLLILTGMIYAMKVFAGGKDGGNKTEGKSAAPAQASAAGGKAGASCASAGTGASCPSQTKIVAAITAAIMAMTGGRGRILSICPATGVNVPFSRWRGSGVIGLVNNRLTRTWNQR